MGSGYGIGPRALVTIYMPGHVYSLGKPLVVPVNREPTEASIYVVSWR